MLGANGKTLRFTNRQKLHETRQIKYRNTQQRYKDRTGITEIENQLTSVCGKSCDYEKCENYVKMKNNINGQLFEKYQAEIFRKHKWFAYINKQRCYDRLLDRIKETYTAVPVGSVGECRGAFATGTAGAVPVGGNDAIICYGDWSARGRHLKGNIPTPGIGLKRKIASRFKTHNFDEYRTSCLDHVREERCENMWLPDKNGKLRHLHSVLTYQMLNNRVGCINRDRNAVLNMMKIVREWISSKTRPLNFRREKHS